MFSYLCFQFAVCYFSLRRTQMFIAQCVYSVIYACRHVNIWMICIKCPPCCVSTLEGISPCRNGASKSSTTLEPFTQCGINQNVKLFRVEIMNISKYFTYINILEKYFFRLVNIRWPRTDSRCRTHGIFCACFEVVLFAKILSKN